LETQLFQEEEYEEAAAMQAPSPGEGDINEEQQLHHYVRGIENLIEFLISDKQMQERGQNELNAENRYLRQRVNELSQESEMRAENGA